MCTACLNVSFVLAFYKNCRSFEENTTEDIVGFGNEFGLVGSKSFESMKSAAVSSPMTAAAMKSAKSGGSTSIQIKAPKAEVVPPAQMGGLGGSSFGSSFLQQSSPIRTPLQPKPVQTREDRNKELRRVRQQEEILAEPTDEKMNLMPHSDTEDLEDRTDLSGPMSAEPVVRFRTASRSDLLEQHQVRQSVDQVSVIAKRPISKPITVSRRFDAVPFPVPWSTWSAPRCLRQICHSLAVLPAFLLRRVLTLNFDAGGADGYERTQSS